MSADLELIRTAADHAITYAATIDDRRPTPTAEALAALTRVRRAAARQVRPIRPPRSTCSSASAPPPPMATTGRHYFGFVTGATYPVALGGAWLANAWDQNAALPVMSPVRPRRSHDVAGRGGGRAAAARGQRGSAFVTGATVANASLPRRGPRRAARPARLGRPGRRPVRRSADPGGDRRAGAQHAGQVARAGRAGPRTRHVVPERRPGQAAGRPAARAIGRVPVLVCAQAGEVNTGAFDPFDEIADWLAERGGWLHVDGAFGLWALADPTRAHLVAGLERADSWATDGHKWLNVSYDCGLAVRARARRPAPHVHRRRGLPPRRARQFEAMHHTPQSSQRARQIEVWAVLRTLGRAGVAELVQQACAAARTIADALAAGRAHRAERRGAQPGARPARRPAHHRGDCRRGPGRRPGLVRPDPVGRGDSDADQRVVVEDRPSMTRWRPRR